MASSVFCIASGTDHAENIVRSLKTAGFADDDISVLFPDKRTTRDFGHEHHTKAPEGAAIGAGTGGVVGGTIGLLAGIGALAIPGLGPFIAAGPIMATLGGAAVGGTVGGLTGALIGMGVPEYEAKRYEGKLRGGNVLISAHCENGDEAKAARRVFDEAGAQDIHASGEASADVKVNEKNRPATAGRDAAGRDTTMGRAVCDTNVNVPPSERPRQTTY